MMVERIGQELMVWMERNEDCEDTRNYCEQKKGEIINTSIAIGVVLSIVVLAAVIISSLVVMCCYKRQSKNPKLNNLTQTNSNLTQENKNLTKNNIELKERERDLMEKNKDLKQQIKDRDVIDGITSIKYMAEGKKGHFSDNPEIQLVLEEFVTMSNEVIKIVKSRVEPDSDGDHDRVERIKQVMESVNRQLQTIL